LKVLKNYKSIARKLNIGNCKIAKRADYKWIKTVVNEYTPPNETLQIWNYMN
jgi:hypothetical protein